MSQLIRPHKGASLGRGQRPEVEAEAKADARERRFPRANHYRGEDAQRRDGRLVQFGEKDGQKRGVRRDQAAHQRGDQRRGEGRALPRAVHVPPREPLPQPLREERRRRGPASSEGRRCLEGLLRSTWGRARRRIRDAIRNREYLPSDDVSKFH